MTNRYEKYKTELKTLNELRKREPSFDEFSVPQRARYAEMCRDPYAFVFYSDYNIGHLLNQIKIAGFGNMSVEELMTFMNKTYRSMRGLHINLGPSHHLIQRHVSKMNHVLLSRLLSFLKEERKSYQKYLSDWVFGYGPHLIDPPVMTSGCQRTIMVMKDRDLFFPKCESQFLHIPSLSGKKDEELM